MASTPYKRRKPRILKNLWIYRRLVGLAFVVGIVLWFMLANKTSVEITFPFGLGKVASTTGVLILASALAGSVATFLVMTVLHALRRRDWSADPQPADDVGPEKPDLDRPPPDYASRAEEGIVNPKWK